MVFHFFLFFLELITYIPTIYKFKKNILLLPNYLKIDRKYSFNRIQNILILIFQTHPFMFHKNILNFEYFQVFNDSSLVHG